MAFRALIVCETAAKDSALCSDDMAIITLASHTGTVPNLIEKYNFTLKIIQQLVGQRQVLVCAIQPLYLIIQQV